jgi:hypothetical protein
MFKNGEMVICVDDIGAMFLKKGKFYTVSECWDSGHETPTCLLNEVHPNPHTIGFDTARFRSIETLKNKASIGIALSIMR